MADGEPEPENCLWESLLDCGRAAVAAELVALAPDGADAPTLLSEKYSGEQELHGPGQSQSCSQEPRDAQHEWEWGGCVLAMNSGLVG